jgi:exopolysaccharide biosynthesis protein
MKSLSMWMIKSNTILFLRLVVLSHLLLRMMTLFPKKNMISTTSREQKPTSSTMMIVVDDGDIHTSGDIVIGIGIKIATKQKTTTRWINRHKQQQQQQVGGGGGGGGRPPIRANIDECSYPQLDSSIFPSSYLSK